MNNATLSDGDAISDWKDLSGNGNNATQTINTSNQPILSNQAIVFDGSNDYMILPDGTIPYGNSNYTVTVLLKANTIHSGGILGSGTYGTINQTNAFRFNQNNNLYNYWWGNDILTSSNSITINEYFIVSFSYDNQSGRSVYINGQLNTSDTNTNRSSTSINNTLAKTYNTEYLNGEIVEVIIFDDDIDENMLIKINYYLSKKWGIESIVDSDGDGVNDNEDSYPIGN